MSSEQHTGTIYVRLNSPGQSASVRVPLEIRDEYAVLKGTGLTGEHIATPPGRYFVNARLPDGQVLGTLAPVQVASDFTTEARLYLPEELVADADGGPFVDATPLATAYDNSPKVNEESTADTGPVADAAPTDPAIVRISTRRGVELHSKVIISTAPELAPAHLVADLLRQDLCVEPRILLPTTTLLLGQGETRMIRVSLTDYDCFVVLPYDPACVTHLTLSARTGAARPQVIPELRFDGLPGVAQLFAYVARGSTREALTLARDVSRRLREPTRPAALEAVIAGYVLLRLNVSECLQDLADGLLVYSNLVPDTLAIRIEVLARLGLHSAAAGLLTRLRHHGTPWFASGISYLDERLRLYTTVSREDQRSLALRARQVGLLKQLHAEIRPVVSITDRGSLLHVSYAARPTKTESRPAPQKKKPFKKQKRGLRTPVGRDRRFLGRHQRIN